VLPYRHLFFAALVGGVLACNWGSGEQTNNDDNDFRPDVFYCEDALARLAKCCPGFIATEVACTYFNDSTSDGCGSTTSNEQDPAFSTDESQCILQEACGMLVTSGVCQRAQVATSYVASKNDDVDTDEHDDTSSGAHAPVCP
jgi:hypothetical protein